MIIFWRKIRHRLSHCLHQYGVFRGKYRANSTVGKRKLYSSYDQRYPLKQNFPEVTRGFSERNIRLFYSQHEIHKRSDLDEVDSIVEDSIREVCINMHIHILCGKAAHSL